MASANGSAVTSNDAMPLIGSPVTGSPVTVVHSRQVNATMPLPASGLCRCSLASFATNGFTVALTLVLLLSFGLTCQDT